MEGEPSDSAQAEKRWYEFERFLSGTPSELVETESGCRVVPNKLFSHHRILPRPELDVEQVPDKLFHTIEFCRDRKWM